MSENELPSTLPDSTPIRRLIRRNRSLLRSSWVATGLGLVLGLLLGTLVTVTVADLVVPLWPGFRLAGLVLIIVPATWALFSGVLRPLFRRLSPGTVARRIESHIPGMHNRLVSCIDLGRNPDESKYSPAFYRRLHQETLERIKDFRARRVVDFLSLRRAGLFAFVSAAAFVLVLGLFSDRLPRAIARVLHPFEDLPPVSGVDYAVVVPAETDAKVLRGEDIVFKVQVDKGEPEGLRLDLRTPDGDKIVSHELKKAGNNLWQVTLNSSNIGDGFEHAFTYRVVGGGTWTKQRQVAVVERPTITGLSTLLHYPDYMAIAEPEVGPPQKAEVTGPEESRVEVVVQVEGDVKEGAIQILEPRQGAVKVEDQVERVWFEDKAPGGAREEGWVGAAKHGRATHTEPPGGGEGGVGHSFQAAQVGFQVEPGEDLFAYVYLEPANKPEAIMVEWHDGQGWEHRAWWGVDKIRRGGQPGTAANRRIGPLPAAGEWVRLQVPADRVGLQGKLLRGMSFLRSGGECSWQRAGTVRVEQQVLVPIQAFAMKEKAGQQWTGSFPLRGSGLYRVEMRNELGYPNKTMKEAQYLGVTDEPPQVHIERPASDLVLSEPGKVPLVIVAADDYGLADVSLAVQRGDNGAFQTQVVQHFDKADRKDFRRTFSFVTGLDLAEMKIKFGESVRYRAEARDRKGQVARTQDFVIRLAQDANAADRQLAEFDKSEDPFREKLAKLIGEQAKVRDAVEKMAVKYAPLDEKLKAAMAEARAKADAEAATNAKPGEAKPPVAPVPPLKLDPESEKMLQALRQELNQLAKQEQQNVQLGQQVDQDLARIADQAGKLQLLPRELAADLQAMQELFQKAALQPLQDLANRMNRGADANQQADPSAKPLRRDADRVQKELEAMQQRLKALDEAQRNLRKDAAAALAQLHQDMLKQKGGMNARDLEELKDFIAALRKELQQHKGTQEDLRQGTDKVPDSLLNELEKQQAELDKGEDEALGKTKDLQASDKMKRMKKKHPNLPDEPYDPEGDGKMDRPREEDTDEPDAAGKEKKAAKDGKANAKDKKDGMNDDEEDLFMPALGGAKKTDPRYADKVRPVERKGSKDGKRTPGERRDELGSHQDRQLRNLHQADSSLEADEQTVEQMLRQLRRALNARNRQQQGPQSGQHAQGEQDLAQFLRSQALQQALAMAQRMQQGRNNQSRAQQQGTMQPNQSATGNLRGAPQLPGPLESELDKLDLDTRAAILKMPPKLREELLQSIREEGPEGYREMIQDYFKKLTEVKSPK